MRKKIVAGNWKMNTLVSQGKALAEELNAFMKTYDMPANKTVIIGTPFTHLSTCVAAVDTKKIHVAAQNCSQFEKGAYTGEVAANMIKDLGVEYTIIGHSERRQYFGDTDEVIATKLDQCYANGLSPILCCGEKLEEREAGKHFEVIESQLRNALKNVSPENFKNTIVAYEPVWAIGTGKTATPEQAEEIHAFIRGLIAKLYNAQIADDTTILYGGSVNAGNAANLFAQPDIDGGLVGGASLKANDFISIIKAI
ncbi:MAG: triose-phosphate isomerase [Bacteroidales bacterium]|jgi:triosephosphate isomerase|nr:triose-phosphate isomerase [Bacteroidales bacterium]